MWAQALHGVRKHLLTYSARANLTILAERPTGLSGPLSPKMDHLVCFMPGTIALGATGGLAEAEARKSPTWGPTQEADLALARELTKTCWAMYKVMATGLAPEIAHFEVGEPARMHADDGDMVASAPLSEDADADWRRDFVVREPDSHNLQRPETVESLFYMWRVTGDEMYREWGWEMFKAFVQYTEAGDGAGFTSLAKANQIPPVLKDDMESFWLVSALGAGGAEIGDALVLASPRVPPPPSSPPPVREPAREGPGGDGEGGCAAVNETARGLTVCVFRLKRSSTSTCCSRRPTSCPCTTSSSTPRRIFFRASSSGVFSGRGGRGSRGGRMAGSWCRVGGWRGRRVGRRWWWGERIV